MEIYGHSRTNKKRSHLERMTTIDGISAASAPVGRYVYRITNTGASSAKFGHCEVCGRHVSEVWHLVEGRIYAPDAMTYHKCRSVWGHRDCLEAQKIS